MTHARRESRADAARRTEADPRWAHVVARDAASDGTFVFAVATTGIYCRPSCASRRARPENVSFFAAPDDAERAGFRACLRCAPRGSSPDEALALALASLVDRAIDEGFEVPPLSTLARAEGVSIDRARRAFERVLGVSPRAYGIAKRRARLEASLRNEPSVTRAIHAAGYRSTSRAHGDARAQLSMSPRAFRDGGRGLLLRYATGPTPLGRILLAATEHGVCALLLGDDDDALLDDLRRRFPHAELEPGGATLDALLDAALALVRAPHRGHALPLDVRATAFTRRVWEALRAVPAGETVSYAELARRLGAPSAARAVARACAANPIAIAIPCHRVVRGDGGLSGYRWGRERKAALLEAEATHGEPAHGAPAPSR